MIEEFSFGNIWSFKDIQSLNLTAAKIKSHNKDLDNNNIIHFNEKVSFLKTKAIYGANAGGKSNIIKALTSFIRIIKNSVKDEKSLDIIEPFMLSNETEEEPSFFQLIFWYNNTKYRYGFEASEDRVYSEWLFSTPNIRETALFIREGKTIVEVNEKHYPEGFKMISLFDSGEENGENSDSSIYRENSLFLSSVASFGLGKLSKKLVNYITSITIISGLGHKGMYSIASDALKDSDQRKAIVNFLKYADVGIEDLDTVEVGKEVTENENTDLQKNQKDDKKQRIVISKRYKYNSENEVTGEEIFTLNAHESEGTKKMFEISPFILRSLEKGTPLIIDEFDSRFHPLLTRKIVELYNSVNNASSQLIFTTHDTNLLSADLLRRDQIDFVEKDKYGASHLYTLVQFKGIRNTASFEKDYIQGKYGAIPFLGDFNKIFKTQENA